MEPFTAASTFTFAKQYIPKLVGSLISIRGDRKKEIDQLGDVFGNPEQLAAYYIEPECQQFNPADYHDEARHVVRESLFKRLEHFFSGPTLTGGNQLFLLADSGMGKTSALMILKLGHVTSFWPKGYDCILLKIGPDTIEKVNSINAKSNTILMLDALDEDPAIWGNTIPRLTEILSATVNFKRVIISCRTQFFSGDEDPFDRRGQVVVGSYLCPTIFLSLFNDSQVTAYCEKRFSNSPDIMRKAKEIALKMKSLRLRPMLLAHIEDILSSEKDDWTIYSIYDSLITVWLHREIRKTVKLRENSSTIDELRTACKRFAVKLETEKKRTLSAMHFHEFIQNDFFIGKIETMEVGGRSLLNRNSNGEFRFSHSSIQEFLVAESIVRKEVRANPGEVRATRQTIEFLTCFLNKVTDDYRSKVKLTALAMLELDLEFVNFSHLDMSNAVLERANLSNANLNNADLSYANLRGVNLEGADIRDIKLIGADLTGANLSNLDLSQIDLTGTVLQEANMAGVNLSGQDLTNKNMLGSTLIGANISDVDLTGSNFINANMSRANFKNSNTKNTNFTGADLSHVDLCNTNIEYSILKNANLSDANIGAKDFLQRDLEKINFSRANLCGACFAGANLRRVNFSRANLTSADFSESRLHVVDMQFANIKGIKTTSAEFFQVNVDAATPIDERENLKQMDSFQT